MCKSLIEKLEFFFPVSHNKDNSTLSTDYGVNELVQNTVLARSVNFLRLPLKIRCVRLKKATAAELPQIGGSALSFCWNCDRKMLYQTDKLRDCVHGIANREPRHPPNILSNEKKVRLDYYFYKSISIQYTNCNEIRKYCVLFSY